MTEVELSVIGSILHQETRQEAVFLAPDALFCSDEGKTLIAGVRALQAQGYPVTGESLTIHLQVEAGVDKDTASSWVSEALARRASKENLGFMVASLTQSKVQAMAKEMSEEVGRIASSARIGDLLAKIGEFQRDLALLDNQRAEDYRRTINELSKQQLIRYFTPGMGPLDRVLKFYDGDVCYIGGRSGGGKSSFLLNMALNMAASGHRIGVIEVEMRRNPLASRLAGIISNMDTRRIMEGEMNETEREHIRYVASQKDEVLARVKGIEPSQFHADMLRPTMERWRDEWGCEVFMLDYIQNVTTKYMGDDYKHVTYASRCFTSAAKETGLAAIGVSQARRGMGGEVGQSDFKGSAQLEHDASVMVTLNTADGYVPGDPVRKVWCEGVKSRNGFTFKDLLDYHLPTQTFTHSGEFAKAGVKEEKSTQFPFK